MEEKYEPKTVEELGYLESCVRNRFTEDEIEELKKACKCYDEMYDLYLHNSKFKNYVDRVCKSYQFRVEFALLNVTVQEVGRQYAAEPNNNVVTRESFVCACEQEDKSC